MQCHRTGMLNYSKTSWWPGNETKHKLAPKIAVYRWQNRPVLMSIWEISWLLKSCQLDNVTQNLQSHQGFDLRNPFKNFVMTLYTYQFIGHTLLDIELTPLAYQMRKPTKTKLFVSVTRNGSAAMRQENNRVSETCYREWGREPWPDIQEGGSHPSYEMLQATVLPTGLWLLYASNGSENFWGHLRECDIIQGRVNRKDPNPLYRAKELPQFVVPYPE